MSFKIFLNESQLILNEYSKHPISELIARRAIPLDPGMMSRLGFLEEDVQAYHVTNSIRLDEMAKNQNKKKQLSCFTKGGPELARLPSQPNVLLLLEGTSVVKGETDIWTLVSTRDRRWLDIGSRGKDTKLFKFITGVLQTVANKAGIECDVYNASTQEIQTKIESLPPQQKVQLYRLYLTEMEAFLNKQYKVLINYLKNAAEMSYNEVILTKWKILDVWCIEIEQPNVEEKLKELNLSYAGVILRKDLGKLEI